MNYLLILLLLLPFSAYPGWLDFWQTKDQQAKQLLLKGKPKEAAKTFKRKDWQSVAHYRAGQYKQAAKLFSSFPPSLSRFYNEGNALAHLGQYESAIKAYDKALEIKPDDKDTQYNKEIVEALLRQQKKQEEQDKNDQKNNMNNQEQPKDNKDQKEKKDPKDKQGEKDPKQDKEDEKNKQDQKDQEKQKNKPDQKDKQQANKNQQSPKLSDKEKENQQAQMQRLKRVPDDPGGLLRQKFLRDFIKRHPEQW